MWVFEVFGLRAHWVERTWYGAGFRAQRANLRSLRLRVLGSGFRVQDSGFGVLGFGFRVNKKADTCIEGVMAKALHSCLPTTLLGFSFLGGFLCWFLCRFVNGSALHPKPYSPDPSPEHQTLKGVWDCSVRPCAESRHKPST